MDHENLLWTRVARLRGSSSPSGRTRGNVLGDRFQVQVSGLARRTTADLRRASRLSLEPVAAAFIGSSSWRRATRPPRGRVATVPGLGPPVDWRRVLVQREGEPPRAWASLSVARRDGTESGVRPPSARPERARSARVRAQHAFAHLPTTARAAAATDGAVRDRHAWIAQDAAASADAAEAVPL